MSITEIVSAIRSGALQAGRLVKLDTPLGADNLLPQRVYGYSRIGRNYEFRIDAIHVSATFKHRDLMAQPVTLWIQQTDRTYAPHHGYVHAVHKIGSDGGVQAVQLTVSSWLHFLRYRHDARNWQDKTVEQILADVFNQHPRARGAFRFVLRDPLPVRSFVQQYEDDWNFAHRLMEEEGLFFYFEQAEDGKSHAMVIVDSVEALPAAAPAQVPFCRSGVGDEIDGFTHWEEAGELHSTQLTTRTFDYKHPASAAWPKGTAVPVTGQGGLPWEAEVYEYTGAYTFGERERGDRQSRIRVEQWESAAQRLRGSGGMRRADAGRSIELVDHPERQAGGRSEDWQFVTIETVWGIENNLPVSCATRQMARSLKTDIEALRTAHGGDADALAVHHADGGTGFFVVQIEAQRRALPYRSPFEHHKPVMQIETATVVAGENELVRTDALNRIKVRFHWDRLNGDDSRASCWVRTAFADAGGGRGAVHVPRPGEEVLIGWLGGDCDRPVAIGRVFNGANRPQWHTNGILSGLQSREYGGKGYNMLAMDDATGQPRVQLASSSTGAHLHLGYLIDQNGNMRGAFLGNGFDLKSQAYGAVRGGLGLYFSTHPVTLQPFDARPASNQLATAARVMDSLSQASTAHQADSLGSGHDTLKSFADATEHSVTGTSPDSASAGGLTAGGGTGQANAFSQPLMLLASPAGIGLSTQQSTHIASDAHTNFVSGQNTHIAAGRSLIASVVETVSLFVQNAGMKLFAGKGKVQIQAHADDVEVSAHKAVRLASVTDSIHVVAKKEILLTAGGAYIRIADGKIEIHAPGMLDFKGSDHAFGGPAQMNTDHPAFPKNMPTTPLALSAAASPASTSSLPAGMPYTLLADGAVIKQGVLDASGQLPIDHFPATQQYRLQLANGVMHDIPVPAEYHSAANGELANQGFHFHESNETGAADRAMHRQAYHDVLNPDANA
ncbi:type VI secretion system Vgr family protein [Ralstonia pseudosolanacearum]|uniref:type VI secretion system Vgr family protein n=1 Tax=Ralstonia pseudosolanacearum TaxID=1310165 RepID=UPI0018A52D7B|nr:type VI secretion system tip protein VgrG [Ralstonia pseudosolanacearum]BCL91408.1 type IV secretion protein Rhs [Ralstonia solanacearum]BCN03971.1 type IV secretion protein Rhs [Ralstonia solanacearum]